MALASRWLTARQRDQLRLLLTTQDRAKHPRLRAAAQGRGQAVLDEPLAESLDESGTDIERRSDLAIIPGRTVGPLTDFEQGARTGQHARRLAAGGELGGQLGSLVGRQGDAIQLAQGASYAAAYHDGACSTLRS
ncbi:MAG: hypothetical protein U0821_07765 [Chloroflexota bacterium]